MILDNSLTSREKIRLGPVSPPNDVNIWFWLSYYQRPGLKPRTEKRIRNTQKTPSRM